MENKREERINTIIKLYQYDLLGSVFYDELADFVNFNLIVDKILELDSEIEKVLFNYSLKRLSYLDRAIIRLATYELLYSDLDPRVIINEAIEISKLFCDLDDQKQHKFNNKLLDTIKEQIRVENAKTSFYC